MDPATVALLLRGMFAAMPALVKSYNEFKAGGEYNEAERNELDQMIEDAKTKDYWQE